MKEFKVFQMIKDEPSKNGKLKILKDNETEDLKTLLGLTYNSFKTYRVQQIEQPSCYNTVMPNVTEELKLLLNKLAEHQTGSIAAKSMIKNLLSKCTPEGANWVCRIINRHLDIGIDTRGINKVFPNLIPVFDVMLAFPIDEHFDSVEYPIMVDAKKDGLFTCTIYDGEKVTFFSRDGNEFPNLQAFSEQIIRLSAGEPRVFIGEFDSTKLNSTCKSAVKAHKAGKNWKFQQSISMAKSLDISPVDMREYTKLVLWDVVDYEYFTTQGRQGKKEPASERRLNLFGLFNRLDSSVANLEYLECYYAHNQKELVEYRDMFIAGGDEGLMGKRPSGIYEFKRSKNVLKYKKMLTADLRITDAIEGEGKITGTLGALVVTDGEVVCKVGSGFSEVERDDLWSDYISGNLKGKIVEIQYQERTHDNSLRFPSFLRMRTDKTETSWN